MTYCFGWWDYLDGTQSVMVNRYTHEKIVRRGEISVYGARPDETWLQFDYLGEDFTLPLAVLWMPEQGKIVIDYNLSWTLRSDGQAPCFGAFARVDDIAADALWCWPGVIDTYFSRRSSQDASPLTLFRLGGWLNGAWDPQLVTEEVNDLRRSPLSRISLSIDARLPEAQNICGMFDRAEFLTGYESQPQFEHRVQLAQNAPAPSAYTFVDPRQNLVFDSDYPDELKSWLGEFQFEYPFSTQPHVSAPPHVVSADRNRAVVLANVARSFGHGPTAHWGLNLGYKGRHVASISVTLPQLNQIGPFQGSAYRNSSRWVCAFDGLPVICARPNTGIAFATDYTTLLEEITTEPFYFGTDGLFVQRDFAAALLQFRRVSELSNYTADRREPSEQKFDCVASSSKLLGGRVVWSRLKLQYFRNQTRNIAHEHSAGQCP